MIDSEVLLQGYRLGVFPMAMDDGEIEWVLPDPRAILPLDIEEVTSDEWRVSESTLPRTSLLVTRHSSHVTLFS